MKIFILFISFFFSAILIVQAQPTIDFETGGIGAGYTWTVFENDTPPMEIVANPSATGANTSAMVARMRVLQTNANYAGVVTRSFTPFTLSASNSIVKIMVYKSVISDVGIKFEANFASTGEIKVANTKINEWEELTFDFSGKIGEASSANIDGIVIFPDFNTRTAETITHFDNVTFSASSTGGGGAALPVDFEDAGGPYTFNDFEGGAASVIDNPGSAGINTSAKVAQMKKFAGATYGGTTLALDGNVDFSAGSIVKMKVWASRAVPVTLKLEGLNVERVVSHTGSGTWEELNFDFTGSTGAGVAAITLIFDNGIAGDAAGNSTNWTFYFDDIKLAAALPPNTSVSTIDFETPGNGASYTWNVFENDTPPLEIVANPSATGINTSATVAKMRVLQANANYAGTVTRSFTPFTLNASNSIVKIMVYKNVISDVGIKFEANFASTGEIKVANTKINEWEELTFDFTGKIGQPSSTNIDGLVIFPDFNARTGETISYFDNIRFTSQSTGGGDPTLPVLPLDFQSATINYTFSDFEGGAVTVIANPQSNGINTSSKVGMMVKNPGAVYAGSLIALASPIDFSTNKIFKVKVFMPKVGAKLLLKVENQTDASKNYEKGVTGSVANAWEELTFDYSAINTANQYQKIILIFDLGTAGDGGANFTYLFDDIRLTTAGGGAPTLPVLPLDFESTTINYTFSDFEGGVITVLDNPQSNGINTSAKVGKMVKNPGAVYAGSVIPLASPIDFSTNKTFKVKVFMPKVGAKLLLKVENQTDASKNYEKEATGTVANAWEELTFDYSAISTANQYQKIILIFDLGTAGDGGANFTYLFDDIRLTTAGGGAPILPVLPLDFESTTINYTFSDFEGGVITVLDNPQSNGINTSAKVGKMVKNPGAVYAGSVIPLASPIDFSTNKTFKVKVFMPKVGAKLLLKVENQTDASKNYEKEATGSVANAWEELTFDYSAINTANQYQKIILIFDLGTAGDGGANFTYLFDDIRLATVKHDQQITFPAIADKTVGNAAFALTATASSNLPVTYSTTSDKITISGSQVTIVKAGRASITASQAGNASFNPAVSVEKSFCIKPAKPVITINGGNTEAVTLTSSAIAGNQWYLNGDVIANATNATVAATSQGLYKVKVTVDDCVSEFSDETALIVTGDIQTLFKQVSAYPNPAENYLEVRGIEGELTNSQLFDLTGRANMIVFEKNGDVHQANVQHVTKGVYLLKLTAGNKIHQIKIIKN